MFESDLLASKRETIGRPSCETTLIPLSRFCVFERMEVASFNTNLVAPREPAQDSP
jgi:hypothetical protein